MRAAGVALAATVAAACSTGTSVLPPQGQVRLYVDTDAPVAGGPPGLPPGLFDRLRIDVASPAGVPCDGCTHDFDVTTSQFANEEVSVGIVLPPGQAGWVARVRMFPSSFASPTGDPDPDSTIDVTAALPVVAAEGIVLATVVLSTDDVGRPVGSAASPVDAAPGPPSSSAVGTWAGAQRVDCASTPHPGEVCVPGGAFWMGTTRSSNPPRSEFAFLPPRLVVLSPFFVDASEVTVAAYRAFDTSQPYAWSGSTDGSGYQDWCDFTTTPGPYDAHPLDCVPWTGARAYCTSKGKDLPTEAQWEYAASGTRGDPFVWGSDLPDCSYAVWGRQGWGVLSGLKHACDPAAPGAAPEPLGNGGHGKDVLSLDGGDVFDLAGNLQEWTLDAWQTSAGGCWASPGVYSDPLCGPSGPAHAARGGDWLEPGNALLAVNRVRFDDQTVGINVGFRCARADTP